MQQLRGIRLFAALTDEEIGRIASFIQIRPVKRSEVILREEDTSVYMYFVLEGTVKASVYNEEGRESVLALRCAGEFFGEAAMIDGRTSPATVTAVENGVIGTLSRDDFYRLISDEPKVRDAVLQVLTGHLRDAWSRIRMLSFKNAAERLRMLFYLLSEDKGVKTPQGILLDIRLTHQELADMAGLSRETVTRAIDRWIEEGVLTLNDQRRYILMKDMFRDEFSL